MTKNTEKTSYSRLTAFSWCLYDWANSAFNTVIGTFIFSVYFARGIVGDETYGASLWGYTIGASGFVIAILSPLLGSIADYTGRKRLWLFIFVQLTILMTFMLAFAEPDPSFIRYTLVIAFLSNITFEIANVFYNAMLTDIAPKEKLGRISGMAWGMGYIGGLTCLVVALFAFIGVGDIPPLLHFPTENSAHIRASAILTALWIGIFSLPLFYFYHEAENKQRIPFIKAARKGITDLFTTLIHVKKQKNIALYLLSSAIYRDGLNTIFAVGGLYAAGTFGMNFKEILLFAIGLNITSGLGAFGFSLIDDKIGSKKTIIVSLTGLILCGLAVLSVQSKIAFMVSALVLGIFVGPAQASGRTLMARLSPPDKQGEFLGLYAFTGKAVSFIGPIAFAGLTQAFNNQRAGLASVIVFFVIGLLLMLKIKEDNKP